MIDINALTDEDRGRMVRITEEELGETADAVLVNWNKKFLFVAWPDLSPPSGGHIDPASCRFIEGRAAFERGREGPLWRRLS